MRRRVSAIDLTLAAVLVLLGAASFGWVFGWASAEPLVWLAIAVSASVPVIVAGLLHRAGASLLLAVLVQIVLVVAVGTGLVLAAGGGADAFLTGLVDGWSSLLSFTLPAGGDPPLLVVPVVVTWIAGVLVAETTMRSRSPFAPLVVAIALVVAARLFGPDTTSPALGHVALAAPMVVVGLLLAGRRSAELSSRPTPAASADDPDDVAPPVVAGWLRGALPLVVLATVAAVAVALVLPFSRSAASLRTLIEPPPPSDLAIANPLDALTTDLSDAAAEPVLDLTMSVGPIPEGTSLLGGASPPLRLVTLDAYDGVEWSSSARFLRAGSELPAQADSATATVEVRQDITIGALSGPYLPSASWPRSVEIEGADPAVADAPVAAFDDATGTLVLEQPRLGDTVTYSVVSQVPAVTAAELASAGLPASSAFAGQIELPPGLPAALGGVADQAMGRAASPFQQLAALESWLRTNGELDLEAPGGNSYGALQRFLVPDEPAGPGAGSLPPRANPTAGVADLPAVHVGTPQQFATAFAVLARSHGLPTRVVIGYRTDAAAGPATVVRGQTAVWPEAYLAGIGWVPFDPSPALGTAPSRPSEPEIDEVAQAKTEAAARAEQTDQSIPAAVNPIVEADDAGVARNPLVILGALLGVALLVLVAVIVARPLRARRRRRRIERSRRSARTPREQVLGAWHHVVDALEDHGAPPLTSATVADVAAVVDARWGPAVASQVVALGAVVNDTLFDPDGDGSTAAGVWPLADAIVTAVRAAPPVVAAEASVVQPARPASPSVSV